MIQSGPRTASYSYPFQTLVLMVGRLDGLVFRSADGRVNDDDDDDGGTKTRPGRNALLVSSFDFNLQILVVDLINSSCRHIYMQLISRGGCALFCHGGVYLLINLCRFAARLSSFAISPPPRA